MIKFNKDWLPKKANSVSFAPRLEGARVVLSCPKWEDYAQWSKVRRDNQKYLQPFEPQWADDALTQTFFKRRLMRQSIEMKRGRGAFFLIRHQDNQGEQERIIGGINLNNIQYGAAYFASLGYWLDEESQGNGYMFEATQLVINHAFNRINLDRINAACIPQNTRSANLLLKHGFEEEGFAKKYLQINGQRSDHRLFGLVRTV